MNDIYSDIRPYEDHEVKEIVKKLLADQMFVQIIDNFYGEKAPAAKQLMLSMETIEDLQDHLTSPFFKKFINDTTEGVFFHQNDAFDRSESYLYVSNHRDIILDSAFLNMVLHDEHIHKTEIAIGNNLFVYKFIEYLARLNRTFTVKRDVVGREQMVASKHLSSYIRYAITEKKRSIWIAQKEGRSKDGNDYTNPALLKMMDMSNDQDFVKGFEELKIVPMAISYEYEPCAKEKVEELLKKKHNPEYKKSQQDDVNGMKNGLFGQKGRVHFSFGNPITVDELSEFDQEKRPGNKIKNLAACIDRNIYANYKLWPTNYIATDLLEGSDKFSSEYTDEQKTTFMERMEAVVAEIDFDAEEVRTQYLEMYSKPVFNANK